MEGVAKRPPQITEIGTNSQESAYPAKKSLQVNLSSSPRTISSIHQDSSRKSQSVDTG